MDTSRSTEKKIDTELFLGGDMKFLAMVLGLSNATANHACPWCKVHKAHRHDSTYPREFWNSPPHGRTIEELAQQKPVQVKDACVSNGATSGKNMYGQKTKPLVSIPINKIVIDELHLMLRVTDLLTSALINDAIKKDRLAGAKKALEGPNLAKLIEAVRRCGVTFAVWEARNADGSGSGRVECTSLMGPDKRKVLKRLPEHVKGCLTAATEEKVLALWTDFNSIYETLCSTNIPSVDDLGKAIKEWVNAFVSLGGSLRGYGKGHVTPYVHCLMYHVPYMVAMFGNIRQFSGHGVEKLNDVARQVHHRRSNKHKATQDVLLATGRLEELTRCGRERQKRPYSKATTSGSEPPEKRVC